MANDKEQGAAPALPPEPAVLAPHGAARRRFARAGAAAAGVALTLKSTPGMGASYHCTPSGYASGNLSRKGPELCTLGLSPGFYSNPKKFTQWASNYGPNMQFGQVFRQNKNHTALATRTLYQLVDRNQNYTSDQVVRHLIAAFQNAARGLTSEFLPAYRVIEIWEDYDATGKYHVPGGAVWGYEEIQNYLKSTMHGV